MGVSTKRDSIQVPLVSSKELQRGRSQQQVLDTFLCSALETHWEVRDCENSLFVDDAEDVHDNDNDISLTPLSPQHSFSGSSCFGASTPSLSPLSNCSSENDDWWPTPASPLCSAFLCVYDLDDEDDDNNPIPPAPNWNDILPFDMTKIFLPSLTETTNDVCGLVVVSV